MTRSLFPKILFRVRREYFEAFRRGDKTSEFRRASPFWEAAVERLNDDDMGRCGIAVIVCGRERLPDRWIMGVLEHESAREALGREPSEQGRNDLGDGAVLEFEIGGEVHIR